MLTQQHVSTEVFGNKSELCRHGCLKHSMSTHVQDSLSIHLVIGYEYYEVYTFVLIGIHLQVAVKAPKN